jgi:hypothetical protein
MIYCVKLRQRKLPRTNKLSYFPYDRFYLVPKKDRALADKMFRYFFYMDLSEDMIEAITGYNYEHLRLIPAVGRPTIARAVEQELAPVWDTLIAGSYVLIVPTYPQRTRKKSTDPESQEQPAIPAYYMSAAIRASDNANLLLPQVGVHTPKRDVPLVCAVCRNYAGYCENECSPGRGSCIEKIEIPIYTGVGA